VPYRRPAIASLTRTLGTLLAAALLVLPLAALTAPPVAARSPAQAGGAAAASPVGEPVTAGQQPSAHYLDWMAHADDPVSLAPGGPATIPFRPRPGDRWRVGGQSPVALPAARPAAAGLRTGPAAAGTEVEAAAQVDPNGLRREVFGFLPYWELSDADLRLDYSVLSTIGYFGVGADAQGRLVKAESDGTRTAGWSGWTSSRLTQVIDDAHRAGTRVVLVIQRFSWTTSQRGETVALLSSADARQALATEIALAVRERGIDGVNLDFEPVPTGQRDSFVAFVLTLRQALDAQAPGYQLTFDATGEIANYDVTALTAAGAADAVLVMGYDYRTASAAKAGSIAPLDGTRYDLADTVDAYLARTTADKLILALPWYGRAWSTVSDDLHAATQAQGAKYGYSGSVTYENAVVLAAEHGRRFDPLEQSAWFAYQRQNCDTCPTTWRQVYYDDPESLGAKYDLVNRSNLRGTGIWALGYDGDRTELTATLAAKFLTDRTPPSAGVVDLPDTVKTAAFTVSWLVVDDWSGVTGTDVQVSTDGGPWVDWVAGVATTSVVFVGQNGHGYSFRVRARDGRGNTSPWDVTSVWSASPALAEGGFGRVATDRLNMREGPSTSAATLGTMPVDTLLALVEGPVSAGGYSWFRAIGPIREWAPVSRVQSGFWVAASGSGTQFLVPVQAPNATTVSPAATVGVGLAAIPGTTVTVGGSVILRATSSLASAGQEIVFGARPAGSDAFAPIGTAITGASGSADLRVTVTAGTSYQATLAGDGSSGATSPVLTITVVPKLSLRVAAGTRTRLTTAYGLTVTVRSGSYVTLRVRLSPALANAAVQFFQRTGKTGAWKRITTGRTDRTGTATWSRIMSVPYAATGYGRYVYFMVRVPAVAGYGETPSTAVRVVATR